MSFTERRQKILESLIRDYIDTAHPISSRYLAKKHRLGVSPATIRWELLELTDEGFLEQPHTSAGRIPTNIGYRFFVDNINEETSPNKEDFKKLEAALKASHNALKETVQELAHLTGLAVFGASQKRSEIYGSGWQGFFSQPEINENGNLAKEAGEIIDRAFQNFDTLWNEESKVFIGKEHPFLNEHFSIIFGSNRTRNGERVKLAVFGPNRLNYRRCLNLINFIEENW